MPINFDDGKLVDGKKDANGVVLRHRARNKREPYPVQRMKVACRIIQNES